MSKPGEPSNLPNVGRWHTQLENEMRMEVMFTLQSIAAVCGIAFMVQSARRYYGK